MKKMTRREFLGTPPKILAAAALAGVGASFPASLKTPPNILLIMVDQMQTPPEGYAPDEGVAQGIKEILGFRPLSPDNAFTSYFPGMLRLRQNAVVMRKHYTASAACVPSRASIMTGQYPFVTGVTQTDGLFKTAADVPWLDPDGTPTIGDWFRAAGYSTHYYGKWHVSEVSAESKSLERWGFAGWEKSYPDPHGGPADNAGAFRDVEFADQVAEFLRNKREETSPKPWFVVGSLLNPHDCSIWPINWHAPAGRGVVPWAAYPPPPPIPAQGATSRMGGVQSPHVVELNPDDFPQNNSTLPRTYSESLDNKPRCQLDYAFKWGTAFAANMDYHFKQVGLDVATPLSFPMQGEDAEAWTLAYAQFYFYCHYLVDKQIHRILQALDDNHFTENTIVVFLSDHGELAGAHGGMIQKWHNAYEEAIRVPMVVSSPLLNAHKEEMREITQPTSSIDFAPTVLGLAGFDLESLRSAMETIHGQAVVRPFAGADLSPQVKGESHGEIIGADKNPRKGVFFMTDDSITALCEHPGIDAQQAYDLYNNRINGAIDAGMPLAPGSVRQPNFVRALCTGDWKIVRYLDPHGVEADEWELYCLTTDPIEAINLVDFKTGEVRADATVAGLTLTEIKAKHEELRTELARQDALATQVAKKPAAPAQFQLHQNHPNPFNANTLIRYTLPKSMDVKLEIVNTLGQTVRTLLNARMPAGTHAVPWNATNDHGALVTSGLYYYRLSAQGTQQTRKLMLLK